jgi:hypothetical protein
MVVFSLDDVQKKYGDMGFWELLVKFTPLWMLENITFVFSATYSLAGGLDSPVEFICLPRLERKDFLLTDKISSNPAILGCPQTSGTITS